MLKGRSLVEAPSDDEQFDRGISEVMPALNLKTSDPDSRGLVYVVPPWQV